MKKSILRLVLIVLMMIFPAVNGVKLFTTSEQLKNEEKEMVAAIPSSSLSVNDVEQNISKLLDERAKAEHERMLSLAREENYKHFLKSIEEGETSFRQTFSDSLIMGDSLMKAMISYEIIDRANVMGKINANLNHLEDNIDKIVANNPKKLITHYGINTLYNCEKFISQYERIILKLKEAVPDTEIYVSGIFNVSSSQQDSFPEIAEFNQRLSEMCAELEVGFIDNSECLPGDGTYYVDDGIHLSKEFYTEVWLPHVYYVAYLS